MIDRIARFARYEPPRHAGELILSMVAGLDGRNCWTIAEHRGASIPDGLQHLLARAGWDAGAVRDDLRDYVIDASATGGDPGGRRNRRSRRATRRLGCNATKSVDNRWAHELLVPYPVMA
jgi:hypothetical protein